MSINSQARQKAFDDGLPRYNTGVPCKHGHMSDRYTVNGGCVACASRFVLKVNGARDVLTLQHPVSPKFSDEQRTLLINFLARCVIAFHDQQGVECPIDRGALQNGEHYKRPWTEFSK